MFSVVGRSQQQSLDPRPASFLWPDTRTLFLAPISALQTVAKTRIVSQDFVVLLENVGEVLKIEKRKKRQDKDEDEEEHNRYPPPPS